MILMLSLQLAEGSDPVGHFFSSKIFFNEGFQTVTVAHLIKYKRNFS